MRNFTFVRGALRKFQQEFAKMKNELLSPSERVEAFIHLLGLALRRIAGRTVELDTPPVVQPVKDQEEPVQGSDAQDE
jgi:hypothetical protein